MNNMASRMIFAFKNRKNCEKKTLFQNLNFETALFPSGNGQSMLKQ
jgi:hypothetical protein